MPHHFVTHEDRDKALLYALGLLEAEERRALQEHMLDGCGTCRSEVKGFEVVVEELSYCASAFPPPSRLRQRLLDQVSNERASLAPGEGFPAVRIKRAAAMEWEPTSHEGIWAKYLWVDQDKKRSTRLVRVQPGAKIPPHRHLATEVPDP
jgi:anti-sigma factor ChrR (cupin superfamily)